MPLNALKSLIYKQLCDINTKIVSYAQLNISRIYDEIADCPMSNADN